MPTIEKKTIDTKKFFTPLIKNPQYNLFFIKINHRENRVIDSLKDFPSL